MKKPLALLLASLALSASAFGAGWTVTTLDGQTLSNVQVNKIEADTVTLAYSNGLIKVPFANLSLDDKKILGIQARLDLLKQAADESLASQNRGEASRLKRLRWSSPIRPADYPSELQDTIARYNGIVKTRNRDLVEATLDPQKTPEGPEFSRSGDQAEYERIAASAGPITPEWRKYLRSKADTEETELAGMLKAMDLYKARIVGAEDEASIRQAVRAAEIFFGMPDFALRVLKGDPHAIEGEGTPSGWREQWKYVNRRGFIDSYYFNDGKFVWEELH